MSQEYITVITTAPNKENADNIAKNLLIEKLAGCVQIIGPITSHYWWQDEICQNEEWICLIKSSLVVYDQLEQTIKEIHPYDVPEIIVLPILKASDDYLSWLKQYLK
ncbi:divalent-cation tolerance protein CutA [Cylindrospermum sp. FACHB-282]|uniref:divalent-cation tolerance protein CutA n=1 Tax=Cylindrospermum sp. FACHB-282 TaxID=2692794 RepID=UPI001681C5B7|nr:divalent-cation tolerance protein CutA [Cylindrospermum sp. FACHB-282]MBD2387472.1 divalent-cation tolerance protein CutA [Cylindrospermum sp. FACHB-282]